MIPTVGWPLLVSALAISLTADVILVNDLEVEDKRVVTRIIRIARRLSRPDVVKTWTTFITKQTVNLLIGDIVRNTHITHPNPPWGKKLQALKVRQIGQHYRPKADCGIPSPLEGLQQVFCLNRVHTTLQNSFSLTFPDKINNFP